MFDAGCCIDARSLEILPIASELLANPNVEIAFHQPGIPPDIGTVLRIAGSIEIAEDMNICISAFVIPGGNAERAYIHSIERDMVLYTSVGILTELALKLEEKFGWEKGKIAGLITSIGDIATVLKTTPCLKVLADEPDNRILECALESGSDFLVTGDNHLLRLTNYKNFQIMKLSNFLKIVEGTTHV